MQALAQARLLDATGDRSLPLFGLPCSVKETFAIAGEPLTAGSMRMTPQVPTEDARIVRRLKEAGAIVMARSNVPEFAMTAESVNPRYGRTRNPLDVDRVAGGSSGGEGALVGSGASVFGVGSDILGSIRIPAAFCGVVGFKPHSGAVDQSGTWPVVTGNTRILAGTGAADAQRARCAAGLRRDRHAAGVCRAARRRPAGDAGRLSAGDARALHGRGAGRRQGGLAGRGLSPAGAGFFGRSLFIQSDSEADPR